MPSLPVGVSDTHLSMRMIAPLTGWPLRRSVPVTVEFGFSVAFQRRIVVVPGSFTLAVSPVRVKVWTRDRSASHRWQDEGLRSVSKQDYDLASDVPPLIVVVVDWRELEPVPDKLRRAGHHPCPALVLPESDTFSVPKRPALAVDGAGGRGEADHEASLPTLTPRVGTIDSGRLRSTGAVPPPGAGADLG